MSKIPSTTIAQVIGVSHDPKTDMGYISLAMNTNRHGLVAWSLPIKAREATFVLDFDVEDRLVGIEVFKASETLPKRLLEGE